MLELTLLGFLTPDLWKEMPYMPTPYEAFSDVFREPKKAYSSNVA